MYFKGTRGNKKRGNSRHILSMVLLMSMAFACCLLAGCKSGQDEEITSISQLKEGNRRIGVPSDTADDRLVAKEFPEAQIEYFKEDMAAYTSVSQGKIDAFVYNRLTMETAIHNGMKGVRILDESLGESQKGAVAISPATKIPDLENKVNAFLDEAAADGTIQDLENRWLHGEDQSMPDIPVPESADLNLVVGTTGSSMPFTYYIGQDLAGYDVELAYRFAAWLGATIEFKVYDYDGIVAAAQGGDVDCIFANLFITPEREEAIRFSKPTYISEVGVMVRDLSGTAKASGTADEGAEPAVSESALAEKGSEAVTEAQESAAEEADIETELTDTSDTVSGISAKRIPELTEYTDLAGKTVSLLTGAPLEDIILSKAPDVGEFTNYNNLPDMLLALKSGKTDAALINNAISQLAVNRNDELAIFPQKFQESAYGIAFAKGDPARDQWQAAYETISEEEKQALWEKWTGSDESLKKLPDQDWPGKNGTIEAAVCDTVEPLSYAGEDGELKGLDIEMILMIAKKLDLKVNFTGMELSAVLSSVQSGKAKIGSGSIIVTDERKEAVDFVEYYPAAFVLIVRAKQAKPQTSLTLADMEHARIGVVTGTNFPDILQTYLPEAEIQFYNTTADLNNALISGKVDALILDGPAARNMQAENDNMTVIPEELGSFKYAYALSKNEHGQVLCDELSEYIRAMKNDGSMEALQKKWFDSKDPASLEMTDYRKLPAANGTIHLATGQYQPFVLLADDLYRGYEIEILAMFCRDRGYGLDIQDMNTDALMASVQSGKSDIGCTCLAITEERKEEVLFSEPDYEGGTVLLVMKDSSEQESGTSFLSAIRESFEKTFIRENRWKLFLSGIGTTLLITTLSILFGTILGFFVFMLCRNGNPLANRITRFFVWLVQGLPVVVLLMILYYIIFGSVSISGTIVSIIGFTMVFASGVYSMMKTGVGAVDGGQLEAAYALGYTNRKAFFRIILPQALPHFMPTYKGEITSLIKATAVVGYVAVQDLTKMGDIVRSRTYEAFFPLIAVAVIYFILAGLLIRIVNWIELRLDPKLRNPETIRKEVEGND